jgi:hypothetical protein
MHGCRDVQRRLWRLLLVPESRTSRLVQVGRGGGCFSPEIAGAWVANVGTFADPCVFVVTVPWLIVLLALAWPAGTRWMPPLLPLDAELHIRPSESVEGPVMCRNPTVGKRSMRSRTARVTLTSLGGLG